MAPLSKAKYPDKMKCPFQQISVMAKCFEIADLQRKALWWKNELLFPKQL